jgi:hypothetical protein
MDGENRTDDREYGKKAFPRWPDRILGPTPGLKEINLFCWGTFAALLVTQYCYPLWIQLRNGTWHFQTGFVDFIYFYGIGHIANEYPLTRLYDYSLQMKIFNGIFPLHFGAYGPSPYPPFVAMFFSLFARLPYLPAYFLWAGVSLALYIAGVGFALGDMFPGERLKASLIFCFALAFAPFLRGTLADGQIGTVAVFSIGLAVFKERHAKPFSSGLALSILAYKPTLLLLLIPMLLLTRRFRALRGFMTGAALLILAVTACAGMQIWSAYTRFLGIFGGVVGLNGRSSLFLWRYVDFSSFFETIYGIQSKAELTVLASITCAITAVLAVLLWKSAGCGRAAQSLAWAATLTWTLLLNVYVPVYDSVLVPIAVVLTLEALREMKWNVDTGWTVFLSLFIFAASWKTDEIATSHKIQLLSIMLAVLGLWQLYLLRRAIGRRVPQTLPQLAAG